MAETDLHRTLMLDLIETLKWRYASDPQVYVSGNLLVFYESGNKRRHLAPDVLVVKGVENYERLNYLVWEEGKGPDLVIELTSKTTRREDRTKKWRIYEEVLKVPEYFLFDPYGDYLKPPFQGYRWRDGRFTPLELANGCFHSEVLGLDLRQHGTQLQLHEPGGAILQTPGERAQQAALLGERVERLEAENDRLRREIEELRHRLPREH
jgi:Uma2 family endonuclease